MALQAGTRLGPYEVLSLIGAGGMGEVYKARDTRLDRKVAMKCSPTARSVASVRSCRSSRINSISPLKNGRSSCRVADRRRSVTGFTGLR